jgi:predicted nuclease of restriction endonuclease-like (RecB) superfamily
MKPQDSPFNEILTLIHSAKQKAFAQVNSTLIELYSNIGQYISTKTTKENWGKSVVNELAEYIKAQDPTLKGFSDKNLWRMKQFYEVYKDSQKLSPLVREISWTNNLMILSASKSNEEREFYLKTCINERYSKRELERQIKSGMFERTMLANQKLSPMVSQLPQDAKNVFKDVYTFEFLGLSTTHSENDLQKSLVSHLKHFILEIGKDFCFIGEEYKVEVGNKDFSIDLLFYHRELRCLVAFELKIDEFSPAYLGQLEFYLEALDQDVKKEYENPSIGVLLCRQKDDEVVRYALNRSVSPTVISEYETKLIPKELLRQKLNEFYEVYGLSEDEIEIVTTD